jgi:hypothetical protein
MALSLFAAHAVLGSYLNGRTLPCQLHSCLVQDVEERLVDSRTPVLDRDLCRRIDAAAIIEPGLPAPAPDEIA